MPGSFEEFNSGPQSPNPYNSMSRGAHPGAVLLSPQSSSSMNISGINSNINNPLLSPQQQPHSISFNDILDQQSFMLDPTTGRSTISSPPLSMAQQQLPHHSSTASLAAGSVQQLISPLLQSPSSRSNIHASFLDTYGIPQQQQQQQSTNDQIRHPQYNSTTTATNFSTDVHQLCSWLSLLNSSQQQNVMDNILPILDEETLQHLALKLSNLPSTTTTNFSQNSSLSPRQVPLLASPVPNRYPQSQQSMNNLDSVFSFAATTKNTNTNTNNNMNNNNNIMMREVNDSTFQHPSVLYPQWSPPPTSSSKPIYDYIKESRQRPKSAEPHLSNINGSNTTSNSNSTSANNIMSMMKSKNFGMMRRSPTNSNTAAKVSINNSDDGSSSSNSASNSNYNLNSNFDTHLHPFKHSSFNNNNSNNNNNNNNTNHYSHRRIRSNTEQHSLLEHSNNPKARATTPLNSSTQDFNSPPSHGNTSSSNNNNSMNTKNLTDPKLLLNISSWLKSLRLHKYSPILENYSWQDLIELDDQTLEEKGVSALGARRKLLKAFAIVKECKEQGVIDKRAY
ncbi:hypothetical protein NCAS_0I00220 [Naumovozyma castellii]|uniref:RNA-binding protein VTS1 n=1 Tax=Naumovozyma castellii TaxID=27288 RepID=G0VJL0_NAUCA|nr:hypothetical protein NCAS_0I00220 [Naumovozyma castellii CBS 4309]CCC71690.1 hypothetical protein NCAS_0I00220 [Naumovozyma castellii CBS 4309]